MGLSNSFVSLGRVVGPIWAGTVFDLNPGYPYISGAVILFMVFLLSLVWLTTGEMLAGGARGAGASGEKEVPIITPARRNFK